LGISEDGGSHLTLLVSYIC